METPQQQNAEEKAATPSEPAKAEEDAKPADIPAIPEESADVKSEVKPAQSEAAAVGVPKESEAMEEPQAVAQSEPEGIPESAKEVRTEEAPPPLPASNPPSPVTVFAESTKAETALSAGQVPQEPAVENIAPPPEIPSEEVKLISGVVETPVPEPPPVKTDEERSTPPPAPSAVSEVSAPPVDSPLPAADSESPPAEHQPEVVSVTGDTSQDQDTSENLAEVSPPTPPVTDPKEESASEVVIPPVEKEDISETPAPEAVTSTPPAELKEDTSEAVAPADSLQDISTESLPSLPEPVSESLPEPMSLPPVDSVPEPIAPLDSDPDVVPLTNGNANGLPSQASSPADEHVTAELSPGPTKQIVSETVKESEISPESGDKPSEITKDAVAVEE